jgi:hypothetical protein
MPRGGKRKGTGRPKGSSESQEPTKTVRVPLSFAEKIPELLKQHQEENSFEDLQIPRKVHEECLPLEKLAWDAFEVFCFDLIARSLEHQKIYRYGTQGDDQQGVDIVTHLNNGEKWAFQCKQWQRFNRSDAIKVIKQATEFKADRYILLLSRVASVEVRKVIADTPEWEVWDVQDISQKVRELPIEIARRLVRDHFHPEWQNAFLGISKLTPFVSSEDFFHAWLDKNRLFNHTWELEGRNDVLTSLHDFVTSNEKQVAILSGRGGIGKTKLLYEFSKEFKNSNFLLWFVEEGKPVTSENVENLSLYPCIIILDDAHQPEHEQSLKTLLSLMQERSRNQHPEIKLVLSSRPHAIQFLKSQLDRKEINYLEIAELKELSGSEMKALARQAMGQEYTHFADQLALIARDSPLVTVIGGQLLAEQEISINLLERNEEFRRKVLNRFQEVLVGKISEEINPEVCKKILELMAAVVPIQLTNEQFQQAASEFLKIDKATLNSSLGTLEKAGVLLRRGSSLRITPDVLADHILHKACLTEQGDSTRYAEDVFNNFRKVYPTQVLRNLAELDWRVRSSSEQDINLLNVILRNIQEEFKKASNLDRYMLLDLVKEIAYYQPDFSLEIVHFSMRSPATTPNDESLSQSYHFTHSNVLSKLPEIIKRISYTLDYLPICCDLLWQLGRDETSRPYNSDPESIRILVDLAKYGVAKSLKFNWEVLNAIEQWLQEPDAHNYIYSPLDILDPFFEKDIEHQNHNGLTLQISRILVSQEKTKEIRGKALDIIKNLLNSNNVKVTLRVLESLEKILNEIRDYSNHPIEENKSWEPEQLEILEIIQSLVTRDIEPLIQLRAIEKLEYCVRQSCSSAVKQKAQNIIALVPRTDKLKLTGVLSGNYQWDSQADEFLPDWKERDKVIDQILKNLAETFLKKYPFPQKGIQVLNERLQVISDNGSKISTGFLSSLSGSNPEYSIELCEKVLEIGNCPISPHLASILNPARKFDIKRAINILQNAIDSGESSFCYSFAKQYWDWQQDVASDDFCEMIQRLLDHPEFEVKKSAIESLVILIQIQPQLAIFLALNVEVNENTELAEALFSSLRLISLDILKDEELKILLNKLEGVDYLSNSNINKFMICATKKIPYLVFKLILNRIELSLKKDETYKPLPSDYHENCLQYLSSAEEYEIMLRNICDIWLDHFSQTELILSGNYENSDKNRISSSMKLEPLYRKLYQQVSLTYLDKSKRDISPTSLNVLNEWINSNDAKQIKAASTLIREFPNDFIFKHLEFVVNLLKQADNAGDDCYQKVSHNLFVTATFVVRVSIPGQPSSEDENLRDKASEIANRFYKGHPVRKFFDSLVEQAEYNIKSDRMLSEEQWG